MCSEKSEEPVKTPFFLEIVAVVSAIAFLIISLLIFIIPPEPPVDGCPEFYPCGTLDTKSVGAETVVEFGGTEPRIRPVDIDIVLQLNGTSEGLFRFLSNEDGALSFTWGANTGELTYSDLTDNQWIDPGDQIILTGLAPASDYTLLMIWRHTDDVIASTSFSTLS